jgi:hypothetical protein
MMATAPIDGRTGDALVWTGREMLVWGGLASSPTHPTTELQEPSGGAAYDPATDRWRVVADAPIAGRVNPLAAWEGRELLVWGGTRVEADGTERPLADGAVYNPATDTWRKLPPVGLPGGNVGGMLAGQFVIVTDQGTAARYDPAANAWTPLPAAPVRAGGHIGAIAGDRLVLVAFDDDGVEAAILDGTTWRWSATSTPLRRKDAGVAIDVMRDTAAVMTLGLALETRSRLWQALQPCPAAAGGAWTGRYLLGVYGAYDAVTNRCLALPPPPPRPEPFGANGGRGGGVWTGSELLSWSGTTGLDEVYVPNDGAIFRPAAPVRSGP